MARQQRHQKATDVFLEKDWFLGPPVSFATAFPRIATLRVRVKASGEHDPPLRGHLDDGWRTYTESTTGEHIDCRNPVCYNGGLRIGEQLRFMEQAGETYRDWSVGCQGWEGSPKGRKRYRPCDECWQVVIDVTYKQPPPGRET